MEKLIKVKFHSIVDVITNSSTVIFTYQNSIKETKELVQEMLNLMGITDKTPDDIFCYGTFCDDDRYLDSEELPPECPTDEDWKVEKEKQKEWLKELRVSILKNEIKKPEWMKEREQDGDYWDPDLYLFLYPKDEQYVSLGDKIQKLLCSVSADGGRDG